MQVVWSVTALRSFQKGVTLIRRYGVAIGVVGILLAGCGGAAGSGATVTATVLVPVTVTVSATAGSGQATASSESAAPSVGGAGTRTDPIPAGTAATVGDWTITLEPTVTNAADAVAAANQFNKPAPDGKQFVMVKVNATYNGAGSKLAAADLQISFVGSGGNTFGSDPDDYCGVIPEPLINTGEVFTAATASGNECALVTTDQIPGGSWSVKAGFGSEAIFFAQA